MYSKLLKFTKDFLAANVTAAPVTVGYYGEMVAGIDLRQAAILLEPKTDSQDPYNNVWNRGEFHIRLWILIDMIEYIHSLEQMEHLLGAEDEGSAIYGLNATLKKMSRDPAFEALSGSMGGKRWRMGPGGIRTKGPTFSIQQRSTGAKINTAQLELFLKIESER